MEGEAQGRRTVTRRHFPLGFPCPACKEGISIVTNSWIDDAYLVRQRVCRLCGHVIETYEVPADTIMRLVKRAERAKPFGTVTQETEKICGP